jgi:hypothetical protein
MNMLSMTLTELMKELQVAKKITKPMSKVLVTRSTSSSGTREGKNNTGAQSKGSRLDQPKYNTKPRG